MNILELRKSGRNKLIKNKIEDAIIKSDILIQFVLNMKKTELIINQEKEVSQENKNTYFYYIEEIIKGKPVQYITNEQEFMNLKFYVDKYVLIPQPDTEILVEEGIKKIIEIEKKNIKVLDLCTGSGAIAIAIKKYTEKLKKYVDVYASDISEEAIKIAKKNAKTNNVSINFIVSNMFENIKEEDFDIIISNPPYIKTKIIDTLSKDVQNEPHIALDGGEDGLFFYRKILEKGHKFIKQKGYILLEIGYDQKNDIIEILKTINEYEDFKCIKDLSNNDRVILLKRKYY